LSYPSIVGPVRLELTTPGVKDRYSNAIELRTNFVADTRFELIYKAYETFGLTVTLIRMIVGPAEVESASLHP
jgi:hypothetical protein